MRSILAVLCCLALAPVAFSQSNYATVNGTVNTPQFGTITMAMTPGREIQLSARLSF